MFIQVPGHFTSLQKSYVWSQKKGVLKVSTNLPHSAGSSPYTSSGWLGTALLGDRWLGGGVVTKLSGKEDGELLSNSPFRKAKMAVTKNSMVGKGNI